MIIIGEKINSSIPSVLNIMNSGNEESIRKLVMSQCDNHADYLDINTSLSRDEEKTMNRIIDIIQECSDVGIMLDSPNENTVINCIKNIKDRDIIINSVTLNERQKLIDIAKEYGTGIVALPIGQKMPRTIEERINNSAEIIEKILNKGISPENIYLDILVEALATDNRSAYNAIETLKAVKRKYGSVKTTCGLSNISFGLPNRSLINNAFLTYAITNGLDSAIMDNTSKTIMDTVFAAAAVSGNDDYCLDYINYTRGIVE